MVFLAILLTVVVLVVAYAFYEKDLVMAEVYGSEKRRGSLIVAVTVVILVIVWGWYYMWSTSPQRELDAQAKDCSNTTLAFVMSQNYVKQRLKSPSSAEFPYVIDRGVQVVPDGQCGFYVSAYVDSQNGFGAMIRSSYQANISYDRKSKLWRLGDLSIQ
ncbi:hypothetical protein D3C77_432010 [compost metagenome]